MSQKIPIEPDWQSWNLRIANSALPPRIKSSLGTKSSAAELIAALEVMCCKEIPSAPLVFKEKGNKKGKKLIPESSETIFKRTEFVDSWIDYKKRAFPVFVCVGHVDLKYSCDYLRVHSIEMELDPAARTKVLQQKEEMTGFIRRISRLLKWKFGFSLMPLYASCVGFIFKNNKIAIYERQNGTELCDRNFVLGEDFIVEQIQMFIEFYYNFDIVGKDRVDNPYDPLHVLIYALKYVLFDELQGPDDKETSQSLETESK